ncbi:hypothetical protein [Amycolatopsis sp. SID8362]|uniref:hypothetical protein n=1 Tax=Amycolatopsis sp. SID8362 TaxID=2690346 RepID=UPI00136DF0A0|nr:hypothetical protein [Amycolatopsis sp. SID8362]NBH01930.1 hypothetical protein [Amycolatopsis sp. SID8362]NED38633.1 hypothetical protein [Amycolatopsis sp. SID8362]
MGNTGRYGWGYPEVTDPPNLSLYVKNLALAVETTLGAIEDRLAALELYGLKFMGSSAPNTDQTIGVTETILDEKVTFTAVSGRKYLIIHTADNAIASGSPTGATYNYRYAAGATLTTAGTLLHNFGGPTPSGNHSTDTRHVLFTAPSSGQFTVGAGYFTNGGATVKFYANCKRLTVFDIT